MQLQSVELAWVYGSFTGALINMRISSAVWCRSHAVGVLW